MRAILFAASVIALSASAASATTVPHKAGLAHRHSNVVAKSDGDMTNSQPDFTAMLAMFDKLFPPQPDPDPARLALARTSAASMWPNGAYANIMTDMMGTMYNRVMQLKESDLPGSRPKATAAAAPELSIHDEAAAKDPYFDQRAAAIKQVIVEEAGQVSAILDPRIREGLARSMARRFDQAQLTDINGFFATPSGHALASQYVQVWIDPDMMRSMVGTMPEMMKLMPDAMQKIKAAAEKYPQASDPKPAPGHGKS